MEFCTVLQKCNGSKRDKLTVPFYMTRIVTRNKEILAKPELMNAFQDDFYGYNDDRLPEMYKSAAFNGFEVGWQPAI